MKNLVTGSEGFIGRNLMRSLKYGVTIGYDTKSYDLFSILNDIDFNQIKFIYHLGAISNTTEKDVSKIYDHNIWFSIELFKKAIEYNIPVVYASSASVYGNTIKDNLYLNNPMNYYSLSKATVDTWVNENIDKFVHIIGLRFFNVYGSDEQKDDLSKSPIYRFSEQAKSDGIIKVFKGSQHTYRDFVCVDDVIKSIRWASNLEEKNGIYDVGTSNPISFLDVAELCSEKYDVPIKIVQAPEQVLKSMKNGSYQTYTKARKHMPFEYFSVEEWLKNN